MMDQTGGKDDLSSVHARTENVVVTLLIQRAPKIPRKVARPDAPVKDACTFLNASNR